MYKKKKKEKKKKKVQKKKKKTILGNYNNSREFALNIFSTNKIEYFGIT